MELVCLFIHVILIDSCRYFPKEFFFVVETRRFLNEAENYFLILHIYLYLLNICFKTKLSQLEILIMKSGLRSGAAD
jgi:hypothetical protein